MPRSYLGRVIEGRTVRLAVTCTNAGGALTDPTELEIRVKGSDDMVAVHRWPTPGAGESAITKDSTGLFHIDYVASVSGVTDVRYTATGAVANVDEDYFYAEPSRVI